MSIPLRGVRRSCLLVALAVLALGLVRPATAAGPSLTVYSQDLGLVREARALELRGSADTVRIADVPERIDFSSVRLTPAGGARVARLAYRFDVASGDGLLEQARGSRVRVTARGDRVAEGTLVAADGAWVVVRGDDGSLSTLARTAVEDVRIATPPARLSLRPTLEAVIEGGRRGRNDAQLQYLTGGLSWAAEYTVVRTGESGVTWSGVVTVENVTGRDFVDATLKLVAGEPQRTGGPGFPRPMERTVMTMAADAAPELKQEAFSEYHLYSLDRPATLRDRETQSLELLEPRDVKIVPRYVYRGDTRVLAQWTAVNTKPGGLGVPLPGGRVRTYEADASGALQFAGETRIGHTAEDEKISLDVGVAFDLAAERRQTDMKRISDREREYSIEVKLRNRKKTPVTIVVEESVGGDFEIVRKSHDFTRKDANTLEFSIPVPVGQEVVLTYTARVRY
jgi:hypothetical protein